MKTLYILLLIVSCSASFSQVLLQENCTIFTVGNISTVVNNTLPSQGGWRAVAQPGTALSNFQIVNAGVPYGNVFQLEGAATGSGGRYIYNPNLGALWTNRTAGNNIIEVEFDFFTGANTTSDAAVDFTVYDTPGQKALCGIDYYPINQELNGVSYAISGNVYVVPTTPIILLPSTWYRFGMSFNKTTGLVTFRGNVNEVPFNFTYNGAATGLNVGEIDFINNPQPNNTFSITNRLDNVVIRASSTDTLLSNNSLQISDTAFTISPNPASDFVTISNSENLKIKNVELFDLNGRIIKSAKFNDLVNIEINLASFSKGMYLLKIDTENGFISKKIIKN